MVRSHHHFLAAFNRRRADRRAVGKMLPFTGSGSVNVLAHRYFEQSLRSSSETEKAYLPPAWRTTFLTTQVRPEASVSLTS
jgi:hypothetical protein